MTAKAYRHYHLTLTYRLTSTYRLQLMAYDSKSLEN